MSDIKFAVSTKKKIVRLIRKIKTSEPFPTIRLLIQASNRIAKNWQTRAKNENPSSALSLSPTPSAHLLPKAAGEYQNEANR